MKNLKWKYVSLVMLLFMAVVTMGPVVFLNSYDKSVPPTVNDGDPDYTYGSIWHDTNNGVVYICMNPTPGAAVWTSITAGAGGGEANTGTKLGAGESVFEGKAGLSLQFNTLTNGEGIIIASNNNLISYSLDIDGLTSTNAADGSADYIPFYDSSGSVTRKLLLDNIPSAASATFNSTQFSSDGAVTNIVSGAPLTNINLNGTTDITSSGSKEFTVDSSSAGIDLSIVGTIFTDAFFGDYVNASSAGFAGGILNGSTTYSLALHGATNTHVSIDPYNGSVRRWQMVFTNDGSGNQDFKLHTYDTSGTFADTALTIDQTGGIQTPRSITSDGQLVADSVNVSSGTSGDVSAKTFTSSTATIDRAAIVNGSGQITSHSTTTETELGYVNGVTSSIQTQLNTKLADITGEPLSDLSDVTITTIADGELLRWNGSAWINNTLAEAGISAVGHTHDAADTVSGTFANARISQASVTQHQAAIDHDALLNFVANEHIDWTVDGGNTVHVNNIIDETLDHASNDETSWAIAYTVNKSGGDDYGLRIQKTDTTSGGNNYLISTEVDGVQNFYVDNSGGLYTDELHSIGSTTTYLDLSTIDSFSFETSVGTLMSVSDASGLQLNQGDLTVTGGDADVMGSVKGLDFENTGSPSGNLLLFWNSADNTLDESSVDKDSVVVVDSFKYMYFDAAAMITNATRGATPLTEETSSNAVNDDFYVFLDGDTNRVTFSCIFDESWELAGQLKAKFGWSSTNTSGTVEWKIRATSRADGDLVDTAYGNFVDVTDTQSGTANDLQQTGASGTITIGNTPAVGDLLTFEVIREADDVDSLAGRAKLKYVWIQYETDSAPTGW